MKKKELLERIELLETTIFLLSEQNSMLMSGKINMENNEKRFRTIQRTVSRLQDEIALKDRTIKQLKKEMV